MDMNCCVQIKASSQEISNVYLLNKKHCNTKLVSYQPFRGLDNIGSTVAIKLLMAL